MKKLKEFIKQNKIWLDYILIGLLGIIFLKIILDGLFLDINLKKIGNININFLFCSLFAYLFLIRIIIYVFKLAKIKFNRTQKIVISLLIFLTLGFYIFSVLSRKFIYYMDYSTYYQIQMELENMFNSGGIIESIIYIIHSIWFNSYSSFISIFSENIFQFTNKTIDSFVISEAIIIIPLLYVVIGGLIDKLLEKLKVKKKNILFIISLLSIAIIPSFHNNLLLGMPDVIGIVFIFLIVLLTWNYKFQKLEIPRLISLSILTLFLLVSRRWYMYWVVAYYIFYVITLLGELIMKKEYKQLKKTIINGLIFGSIVLVIFGIGLLPMIKRIIASDYSNSYSFYKNGGFLFEIGTQLKIIGLIPMLVIMAGLVYGFINEKLRTLTISMVGTWFLTIILFNSVQSFSIHHSLMLLPTCFLGIIFCYILITKIDKKIIKNSLIGLTAIIFLFNFIQSFKKIIKNDPNNIFTAVGIGISKREDIDEVKQISSWILDNTDENNTVYMINHGSKYNPDIFRLINAPDMIKQEILPYGSAILGTQKFPVGLFDAKYVITCSPFDGMGISDKYDDAFNKSPYFESTFKLNKTFDMNNGYIFYIYERTSSVTLEEIEYYKTYFKKENNKYPNLFNDVIDQYIEENDLR